jgi:signal transduction histidine kinase
MNALHHGGHELTKIRIYTRTSEESLILIVEDNGAGIPFDRKEKIFEFSSDRGARFGLFLIREILGYTGIVITETGQPGKGAKFEILVPRGKFRDVS